MSVMCAYDFRHTCHAIASIKFIYTLCKCKTFLSTFVQVYMLNPQCVSVNDLCLLVG